MESLTAEDPRAAGEFRLRARLGTGGMGRVYLGMSPAGRAVAVKIVHPELARDDDFVGRFRSEVAAAQAVNGIYTAQVVATGPYDNPPWLATAYVPGPTLQQLVDEHGPLAEAALWRLGAGLAEALRAVHAAGLIHRDLKPNNVLVAEDGPRVIDFGVSRALDATSHTRPGQTFGTPSFMSPEQARGQAVGVASDVFSLGAVLCFAATGRAPFGDQNLLTVLYRVVHEEPALDGISGSLRELIAGCLAKDAVARPTLAQLTTSFAAHAGEWDGRFWPASVSAAIRDYEGKNLSGLASRPVPGQPETVRPETVRPETMQPETVRPGAMRAETTQGPESREPAPAVGGPEDAPSTSRRRLLTIAGGLGGVIVAGAAVGWALDRPRGKTPAGSLERSVSRPSTRARPSTTPSGAGPGSGVPAGKVIWRVATDAEVMPSTLAAGGGVVVVGPAGGPAAAYNATTGTRLWTMSIGDEPVQILVQDATVVALGVGQGHTIAGLAAATGLEVWSASCTLNGARMVISGDLCVVAANTLTTEPDVTAYSLSTGVKAWTFKVPGQPDDSSAYITAAGGFFYVGSVFTKVWQLSATGSVVAQFTAPAPWPDPLAVTDQILCGLADTTLNAAGADYLYAMDTATRDTLWIARLDGSAPNSMVAGDGVVYTAGPAGGGSAIMMRNAGTGAIGWRHDWSGNSVVGGAMALGPEDLLAGVGQTLCCLSVLDGDEQWQLPLDGGILAIEVAGDMAYVSTSLATTTDNDAGGWVYAVRL
jgi:hypothetical protein